MMKFIPLTWQRRAASTQSSAHLATPSKGASFISKLKSSSVQTLYVSYVSSFLSVIIASIAFWGYSAHRSILFPYETGLWIQSHQNFVTISCTVLGTLTAALTLYLLNGLLVLMGKLIIATRGASLSTIEVWNRLFNRDYIFDKGRTRVSFLTCVASFAAFYLATAYTTLITPTSILVTESISGTEVDFSSDIFWDWYNSKDSNGNFNRTVTGCQWYTYQNDKGETTFPTCPYNNDPVSLLSAGVAAAQNGLTKAKLAVNYLDKGFEGSTGGALPLAWAGFLPFSDVKFNHWTNTTSYPLYNYTLAQQGLTADVSCQATSKTPIQQTVIGNLSNTILGIDNGYLNQVNFTWTCPNGHRGSAQIVVPHESWATLVVCESQDVVKEYTIYVGAFGKYADRRPSGNVVFFPNLTCSLKPLLTNATIHYTTNDGLFRIGDQKKMVGSSFRVPNETIIAVDRIFSLAISNSENMVIDSLHGLIQTNASISIAAGMENILRGYIEYFATNLRMYYAANEPPGRHPVTGNYTVWRVGYDGDLIVLAGLLSPLVVICGLAVVYTVLGLHAGVAQITRFDPVDVVSLITASAAGGCDGELSFREWEVDGAEKKFPGMRLKYDAPGRRLEEMVARSLAEDELELIERGPRTSVLRRRDSDTGSGNRNSVDLTASPQVPQPTSQEGESLRMPLATSNSSQTLTLVTPLTTLS